MSKQDVGLALHSFEVLRRAKFSTCTSHGTRELIISNIVQHVLLSIDRTASWLLHCRHEVECRSDFKTELIDFAPNSTIPVDCPDVCLPLDRSALQTTPVGPRPQRHQCASSSCE